MLAVCPDRISIGGTTASNKRLQDSGAGITGRAIEDGEMGVNARAGVPWGPLVALLLSNGWGEMDS